MNKLGFLLDVLACSLSSFGGPEAHYGVFSSLLVQKKRYLNEETLSELIGVFSLVPGPSSTQTITAIGYLVGGPWLAFFTFIVWALPAIVIMTMVGVLFASVQTNSFFPSLLQVLPAIALGFIAFAGFSLSKKTIKHKFDWVIFFVTFILAIFLLPLSIWVVPGLLLFGGALKVFTNPSKIQQVTVKIRAPWIWFVLLVIFAIGGPLLATAFSQPWLMLMNRFYRYGYTVIGGGQIVIPLMIQDLVNTNSLISLETFLSGYAIDQAIPGPLFSFAAFVGVQASPTASLSWLVGLGSGVSIFLPGIFLVYLIVPIWQQVRQFDWVKIFLKGIGVSVSAFIVLTAITQTMQLSADWMTYALLGLTLALLVSKKVPAPLIVLLLSGVALLI